MGEREGTLVDLARISARGLSRICIIVCQENTVDCGAALSCIPSTLFTVLLVFDDL